ncbi:hypothetical protein AVEN_60190-1 [Araneus ventricosus]|uniref:Uncharacterized protein n=1 Tax=Araneus ventricosus TaxID=182803 RepID=A0A4Y2CKP0_ARAVE|nr:hypothetical protein AVEN_60190-1 [Araneus ventricosus]
MLIYKCKNDESQIEVSAWRELNTEWGLEEAGFFHLPTGSSTMVSEPLGSEKDFGNPGTSSVQKNVSSIAPEEIGFYF